MSASRRGLRRWSWRVGGSVWIAATFVAAAIIGTTLLADLDTSIRQAWWFIPLFLILGTAWIGIGLPGSLPTISAGVFLPYHLGLPVALVVSWGGATITFFAAGHLHRRFDDGRASGRLGPAIAAALRHHGLGMVVLLRLAPMIPYASLNALMAVARIPWRTFLLGTAIGIVPGTAVFVYLGHIGGQFAFGERRQPAPLEWILLALGIAALITATTLVTRQVRRILHSEGADDSLL